jgi:DNA-directed RNA polymerase specialized sigma24 family protein
MIEATELSVAEKKDISSRVADAHAVLVEKAEMYGFDSVRTLRNEYNRLSKHKRGRGIMLFDEQTRASLNILEGVEYTILSGFIRMANQLAFSFYSTHKSARPHLDECDYLQEATWAIFDAIYCYDGSTQMSTYFYSSVKRRLVGFVRSEEIHAGIGRPTKLLRTKVRQVMRDKMCSFDVAFAILRETENISEDMEDMVRAACYNVKYVDRDKDVRPAKHVEPMTEEVELLLEAVRQADFNDLQREMIEHFLKTGERMDMLLVRERINPNTNQPYTRQGVGQQWQRACDKLREIMEARQPLELAEAA